MTALEQQREDQAFGAAWRRAEAALPEGWEISLDGRTGWVTSHALNLRDATDFLFEAGCTPIDALNSLADALEKRRAEE